MAIEVSTMSDWKYELDEVGPDADSSDPRLPPVEPGSPRLENALPFLIGVAVAVFVFVQVL